MTKQKVVDTLQVVVLKIEKECEKRPCDRDLEYLRELYKQENELMEELKKWRG